MIFGNIEDLHIYKGISKKLDKAIDVILKNEFIHSPIGKNIVDNSVFYNIQECETKKLEDAYFEIHKKYIDIHIVINGEEKIGFSTNDKLKAINEFDNEKDYQFLQGKYSELFNMNSKNFLIVFPGEAHMPLITFDSPKFLKKAVFKIEF